MKLVLFVGLAGYAAASVLERRACTADNCLRALTGSGSNDKATRPVIAKADCSSFLSTLVYATVTPSSVTTTTVVTTTVSSTSTAVQTAVATAEDVITVTTPSSTSTTLLYATTYTTVTYAYSQNYDQSVYKRTATESRAIPTYASACSGAVRYSSACSCLGVFPTTSTSTILVTPTVLATSTSTLTISFAETDTTTQTTTETTSTTLTAGVAAATVDGINFCGVVGRCQIRNAGSYYFADYIYSCQAFAVDIGGLSYSLDPSGICYVYDYRIEDPTCDFNPNNGGLSWDTDCSS